MMHGKLFILIYFFSDDAHIVREFHDRITVNVLKFRTLLFLFSNKMLVFRAGMHKMLVRIANREDPEQTASLEAV